MQKLSSPFKLIEESLKIFLVRENLIYFTSIYLVLIPFQIFSYFQESISAAVGSETWQYLSLVMVVNVLYVIAYFLTSIAGIIAVRKVLTRETLDLKKTMGLSWKNLGRFVILSALVFLATLGGFMLLIIPGIIFTIWFSFSEFVFVDQDMKVKESMSESRKLVKGRFWSILGRFVIFWLFGIAVGVVLSLIPYHIGSIVNTLIGALFVLPAYLLYQELV